MCIIRMYIYTRIYTVHTAASDVRSEQDIRPEHTHQN